MAEALSEAVKGTGFKILWKTGGELLININTDNVEVSKEVCRTAIKLSALYLGYQLLRPVIDAAVKKALGGERDDQNVKDIKPGSLHVVLHCFTDERFLEVLTDYLSGKMKERLEEEFLLAGIKVKGLKVIIQNMAEVNEIKEAIYKRSHISRNVCEDVKNTAMDDKSDIKKNVGDMESQMSVVIRKQNEIVNNLEESQQIVSMATRWENVQEGYDVIRFVGEVKEDLLCLICKDVPRDPRLCMNEDHVFCLAHISLHLKNSQTCPYCRELLTPEKLRRPTGFLKNYLDDLKIKCDYHDRGCPEVVRLENLTKHVDQCGFTPVICGNEGCGMVINESEKENHEKNICKFRSAMCHDCTEIKASQDEMKGSLDEMKANQDKTKASQDEWKDEMKVELNKMKHKMIEIESKQDQVQLGVTEMKQQLEIMMFNQTLQVKEMQQLQQQLQKMFSQALQENNVKDISAQATDLRVSVNNQDIIILGGRYGSGQDKVSKTVEKFNVAEGKSTELPGMNKPRAESASCVYNGDVIVTGGLDGRDGTDSIEILTQHRLRWTMFGGKLPVKLLAHSCIIYQNKLYLIGGYNGNEKELSDKIYELDLAPPYATKALTRMLRARRNHGAEIVDGRLFVVGGTSTGNGKDSTNRVEVYNFIANKLMIFPPLSKAVCNMSTVTWSNKIIIIGGLDVNDQVLNDVIMYDTETGRSERLPSLKHKRCGSSAVIIDDVIVVFGGWNAEQGHLKSVEGFTMGSDCWKELCGMKEEREFASAVVIPSLAN